MENIRATVYYGISGLALLAGVLCLIIAAATALANIPLLALATTYIQIGIASFLFAIWFAVLALFMELRDRSEKGR